MCQGEFCRILFPSCSEQVLGFFALLPSGLALVRCTSFVNPTHQSVFDPARILIHASTCEPEQHLGLPRTGASAAVLVLCSTVVVCTAVLAVLDATCASPSVIAVVSSIVYSAAFGHLQPSFVDASASIVQFVNSRSREHVQGCELNSQSCCDHSDVSLRCLIFL